MQTKELKILIIAPFIFYPLTDGGSIAQFAIIDYLQHHNSITLVFISRGNNCDERIDELKKLLPKVKIQTVKISIPPHNTGMFCRLAFRIDNFLGRLIKAKRKVEYLPQLNSSYLTIINTPQTRAFIERLGALVQNDHFDIVQIDMLEYVDLVYFFSKETKIVFIHHEIRYAWLQTFVEANNVKKSYFENYILSYVEGMELDILQKYHGIITFSKDDAKKLTHTIDPRKVFTSPFPVLDSHIIPLHEEEIIINKLVFIGGGDIIPNKDAIEWFANEILNLVVNKFGLKLHVLGNWDEKSRAQYDDFPNLIFAGFVPDMIAYCKNSIMIVPIRIGSGIRTKILYSMAHGTPVISTTIGCEGIEVQDKDSILIADDALSFVDSIDSILENPSATMKMVKRAQDIIKEVYSQSVAGNKRHECYLSILKDA